MLNAAQQNELAKRDSPSLAAAFSQLPEYWQNGLWLDARNRYRVECIRTLTADLRPTSRVTHKHLREYIAASTIVHGFDGWSYLGRALNALLTGDHDAARHLGYYAELRAAMSILSSEGVGVFSSEHMVVTGAGKCLQIPPYRKPSDPTRPRGPGTHGFVWDALKELMSSPTSASLLLDVTSAGGSQLSEWLGHFASVPALTSRLASDWLRAWGLDIARLAKDRDARNLSSYRPTSFTTPRTLDAQTLTQFVLRLWTVCEPSGENPFAAVDRLLLRATLQNAFRAAYSRTARHATRKFRLRIESVLAGLQPLSVAGLVWEDFLTDVSYDQLSVLEQASGKVTPNNQWHSIQVISRAFLLLRVASGTTQRLIQQLPSGLGLHLDFWTSTIGLDRALWGLGAQPASFIDLWSDTEDVMNELRTNLGVVNSFSALSMRFPLAVGILSSCERVGLWGLGL